MSYLVWLVPIALGMGLKFDRIPLVDENGSVRGS